MELLLGFSQQLSSKGPYNFSHPREWNIAELLGRSKRQIEGDEADTENSGNVAAQPQRKKGRKLKD